MAATQPQASEGIMTGIARAPRLTGRTPVFGLLLGLVLTSVVAVTTGSADAAGPRHQDAHKSAGLTSPAGWTYRTLSSPARVQVLDTSGAIVATFTNGARTVTMRGPSRVFAEPATTSARVTSTTWVRLLAQPFAGSVDTAWLTAELADTTPDVLAVAAQYVTGAPTMTAPDGSILADDADYGPLQPDGTRQEGSDFNDYLGVSWTYGSQADAAESDQIGSLDCSGYTRMVFGYRAGLPMILDPDGVRLPRRAVQMAASAPGVVTIPNTGAQVTSTKKLAPGDLVFFDGSTDDGTAIDHVGIYIGLDNAGLPRFVSSRKTANGPTLGDVGGKSLLTGTGYYAKAWRAARRL
jgi:cell wall-associated NlpC family hydrolase